MRKGASLIWTVVLCTALMFVISTMVVASTSELKNSSRNDSSARAYGAARSGIEWAKYTIGSKSCDATPTDPCSITNKEFNVSDDTLSATATVNITRGATVDGVTTYTAKSKGTFAGVNRVLEYKIKKGGSADLSPLPNLDIINSYKYDNPRYAFDNNAILQFAYFKNSNFHHRIIGFSDYGSNKGIYVKYNRDIDSLELVYHPPSGTDVVSPDKLSMASQNSPSTSLSPYNYLIRLEYVKNTSLAVSVWERNPVTFGPTNCLGSISLDLSSYDLSDLSQFYLYEYPDSLFISPGIYGARPIEINRVSLGGEAYIDNVFQKGIYEARTLTVTHSGNGDGSYVVKNITTGEIISTCDVVCFTGNTSKKYYVKKGSTVSIEQTASLGSSVDHAISPILLNSDSSANVQFNLTQTVVTLSFFGNGSGKIKLYKSGNPQVFTNGLDYCVSPGPCTYLTTTATWNGNIEFTSDNMNKLTTWSGYVTSTSNPLSISFSTLQKRSYIANVEKVPTVVALISPSNYKYLLRNNGSVYDTQGSLWSSTIDPIADAENFVDFVYSGSSFYSIRSDGRTYYRSGANNTWTEYSAAIPGVNDIVGIAISGSNRYAVRSNGAVYKRATSSGDWPTSPNIPAISGVNDIIGFEANTTYIFAVRANGTVYRTGPSSSNWGALVINAISGVNDLTGAAMISGNNLFAVRPSGDSFESGFSSWGNDADEIWPTTTEIVDATYYNSYFYAIKSNGYLYRVPNSPGQNWSGYAGAID